jgi:hypothetical protein
MDMFGLCPIEDLMLLRFNPGYAESGKLIGPGDNFALSHAARQKGSVKMDFLNVCRLRQAYGGLR